MESSRLSFIIRGAYDVLTTPSTPPNLQPLERTHSIAGVLTQQPSEHFGGLYDQL